jgi:hypothetical protein
MFPVGVFCSRSIDDVVVWADETEYYDEEDSDTGGEAKGEECGFAINLAGY